MMAQGEGHISFHVIRDHANVHLMRSPLVVSLWMVFNNLTKFPNHEVSIIPSQVVKDHGDLIG